MTQPPNTAWPAQSSSDFPKIETTRYIDLIGTNSRFYLTGVQHRDGGSYVAVKATIEGVGTKNIVSFCRSADGQVSMVIDEGVCAEIFDSSLFGKSCDEA